MSQKVILISGNLRSGKSTLAKMLADKFAEANTKTGDMRPAPPRIFSFASSIKRIARDEFGWDGEKDEKGRKLLQTLGTEVGRDYNKDIWVNKFSEFLRDECNDNDIIFVDDWRFENECDAIEFPPCGGDIYRVRVRRNQEEKGIFQRIWEYIKSLFVQEHASERGLPEDREFYDFNFDNYYGKLEYIEGSHQFRKLYNNLYYFIYNN